MLEHPRLIIFVALILGAGVALLMSEIRWFRRPNLAARLLPHAGSSSTLRVTAAASLRDILGPLAIGLGARISTMFGVKGDLSVRLRRARSEQSVSDFRLRQLFLAGIALLASALIIAAVRPPFGFAVFTLAALPLLAFLLLEQQLATAGKQRSERLFAELPVMSEQLAMLLSAGYSLGSAIGRLCERGGGAIGEDLNMVRARALQGVPLNAALREWSTLASLPELDRLVAVLALGSETRDLGRLVSEEAKSIRLEAQRRLAETIDRRSQQVWVPVTVATLVPGVIFLTIPFLQALQLFSGS